jgi:catechol 2,3-dioxygenase-like lactoylglutathione lyase family enzyme
MHLALLMIVAPGLARAKTFYGATLGFTLKSGPCLS